MAVYDNYSLHENITGLGKLILSSESKYFINLIQKSIGSCEKISLLEIGPGKGFFANHCLSCNIDYTAIEINYKLYKSLKDKGIDVYNEKVPPVRINKRFDVIFMNQVLEHMKDREEAAMLVDDCRKILNENGIIIITSPEILCWKMDFFAGDYTHSFPTSLNSISQLLLDTGFNITYNNLYSAFFRGKLILKIISGFVRFFYSIGLFRLALRKKAYIAKTSLLPSFLLIGKKLN